MEYYIFDREKTPQNLSLSDVIYNINPSYLGAMLQVLPTFNRMEKKIYIYQY